MDTFVVRLFPVGGAEEPELRGVVSQVASGQSVSFHSVDDLVAFLVDPLGGKGIDEEPAS
ncbi:MAG: hypothetical protein ACRDVN_04170 [Jiangellaceae bacterium]